jgi:hypothetical protein
MRQIAVATTKQGKNDVQPRGGERATVSDRNCDCKTREGMTYALEAEREGDLSDRRLQNMA